MTTIEPSLQMPRKGEAFGQQIMVQIRDFMSECFALTPYNGEDERRNMTET